MRGFVSVLITLSVVASCIDSPSSNEPVVDDVEQAATGGPDLQVTAVSNPPTRLLRSESFSITDTVTNNGDALAAPTQTAYYLSSTGVAPYALKQRFAATRSVPQLIATGANSSGTVSLSIPTASQIAGLYYIVACADYGNAVAEVSETNNCLGSATQVEVAGADLVVTSLSEPPSALTLGQSFDVTETIANTGNETALGSETAYYLSSTGTPPYRYHLRFHTRRVVGAIGNGGAPDTGTITLAAQSGVEPGDFWLVACADYANVVSETSESNNCRASSGRVTLTGADLVASNVTISPAVTTSAGPLTLGETITNNRNATSSQTKTRYVFSTDQTLGSGDAALVDCVGGTSSVWRDVPPVAPGTSNTGTTSISPICVENASDDPVAIPGGTYYVFACADGTKLTAETNENNNCVVSASTVTISGPVCGNSVVESGEQCDVGDTNDGDGCSSTCQIQTLQSLTVTPDNGSIAKGASQQYVATAAYSDGWSQNVAAFATWSTGASATATVSSTGLVTAVAQGTTTVSATWTTVSDSTNVTVTGAVVNGVIVDPQFPTIAAGTSQQFEAVAIFTDGTTQVVTSSASWTSSTPGVASVNSSGRATGSSAGSTTITATYSGFSDNTTLTVSAATVSSIAISPLNQTIAKGTTLQYTAIATFTDGSTQDITNNATWSVGSTAVATISSTGLLTGTQASGSGTTTVRAALSGVLSPTTNITVIAANLMAIVITPNPVSLAIGFSQQFLATAEFKQGATTFYQDVTNLAVWTVSSGASFATVNSTGLATATGVGTANIRATYTNSATAKVGNATLNGVNTVLTGITITPNPLTLVRGQQQQLTATGTFANGTTLDITSQVNWTSSLHRTASINSRGRVKGTQAGTATITARSGTVTGTLNVTVTN